MCNFLMTPNMRGISGTANTENTDAATGLAFDNLHRITTDMNASVAGVWRHLTVVSDEIRQEFVHLKSNMLALAGTANTENTDAAAGRANLLGITTDMNASVASVWRQLGSVSDEITQGFVHLQANMTSLAGTANTENTDTRREFDRITKIATAVNASVAGVSLHQQEMKIEQRAFFVHIQATLAGCLQGNVDSQSNRQCITTLAQFKEQVNQLTLDKTRLEADVAQFKEQVNQLTQDKTRLEANVVPNMTFAAQMKQLEGIWNFFQFQAGVVNSHLYH